MSIYINSQQTFSIKDQVVNIFNFIWSLSKLYNAIAVV